MSYVYPFAYCVDPVHHDLETVVNTVLFFISPLNEAQLKKIKHIAPAPLLPYSTGTRVVGASTAEYPVAEIRMTYNPEIAVFARKRGWTVETEGLFDLISDDFDDEATDEEWAAFVADIDRWVHDVHAMAPLSIFFCEEVLERDPYPEWAKATYASFEEVVLPALLSLWEAQDDENQAAFYDIAYRVCKYYLRGRPTSSARRSIERLTRLVCAQGGAAAKYWADLSV